MPKLLTTLMAILFLVLYGVLPGQGQDYRGTKIPQAVQKLVDQQFTVDSRITKLREDESHSVWVVCPNRSFISNDLVFYRKCDSTILNTFKVPDKNPYNYSNGFQYFDVYSPEAEKVINTLNSLLGRNVTHQYNIVAAGHIASTGCQDCNIVIKYKVELLPHSDMLEHVPYPGYSSYLILDRYDGRVLEAIYHLEHSSEEYYVNPNGQLLITHRPPNAMISTDIADRENEWSHHVSIYQNGTLCYEEKIEGLIFIGRHDNYPYDYIQHQFYAESLPISDQKFLLNGNLLSLDTNIVNYRLRQTGITTSDGTSYNFEDFTILSKICREE